MSGQGAGVAVGLFALWPQYDGMDADGDAFDDLLGTHLRPMLNRDAVLSPDRYSVVLPPEVRWPIVLTAAVCYQSMEAVVAKKFMGNMADTDLDHVLERCVLHGACDGRAPHSEPRLWRAPPVPARRGGARRAAALGVSDRAWPPEYCRLAKKNIHLDFCAARSRHSRFGFAGKIGGWGCFSAIDPLGQTRPYAT